MGNGNRSSGYKDRQQILIDFSGDRLMIHDITDSAVPLADFPFDVILEDAAALDGQLAEEKKPDDPVHHIKSFHRILHLLDSSPKPLKILLHTYFRAINLLLSEHVPQQ